MTRSSTARVAAVSYTGGKDCTLALHRIKEQGVRIAVLVTFSPPLTQVSSFKAHPLDVIQKQAEALGLPHVLCIIKGPNYLEDYRREILQLKRTYGIDELVTGDILPVCSNFMERAVEGSGVQLIRPLWEQPQNELLTEMLEKRGFKILITCINLKKIPIAVLQKVQEHFDVGRCLTRTALDTLIAAHTNASLSPTGEYGELHTMVTECPLYNGKKLLIDGDTYIDEDFAYLKINQVELVNDKE
ncbi:hypothetical protein BDF20DRAFT_853056 [Mycotypha africana]|uniref:uncharacterized protein n=1 Tax=Mycotypha africana TaxID=64632 RepID=UPI0023011DF2|nr:uncharacterized protein BDF20DRAFT_853056 [Mycotypha africana]KAI8987966.1 hypothetical protein BDF20DRAFT_853056 [Mycotypha africana]